MEFLLIFNLGRILRPFYTQSKFLIDKLYHFWYIIQIWSVETLNENVDEEVLNIPSDMIARLDKYIAIIEKYGLGQLPRDAVKNLEGKLWELRIKGKDGISRAIYVTANIKRVVILRIFVKKTQKTPDSELRIARTRMKEVK